MERLTVLKTALARIPGMNLSSGPASSLPTDREQGSSECAGSASGGSKPSPSCAALLLLAAASASTAADATAPTGVPTTSASTAGSPLVSGASGAMRTTSGSGPAKASMSVTMSMEELVRKRHPDCTPNVDSALERSLSARRAIYSYRTLFCRRCFRYDCYLHRVLLFFPFLLFHSDWAPLVCDVTSMTLVLCSLQAYAERHEVSTSQARPLAHEEALRRALLSSAARIFYNIVEHLHNTLLRRKNYYTLLL